MSRPQSAVFLDRDGILNQLVERDGRGVSPRHVDEFRLRPEAGQAVARLRREGFRTFVVTNQPDLARGSLAPAQLEEMHQILRQQVAVDDISVCPHDDRDACECRKPAPGMLLRLATRWGVGLNESVMVGDSWKDVEAGRRAGCRTVLVGANGETGAAVAVEPDARVPSLMAAVEWILATSAPQRGT